MRNRYFFITVDTEEDNWSTYHATENSVLNIQKIPYLQKLLDRYGARPTYFINYPVVRDAESRKILEKIYRRGNCEIGMHIHPWNTPPFSCSPGKSSTISIRETLMCHQPADLQEAKLKTQFEAIGDFLGRPPVSFRCGRWALGPDTAILIQRLGIRVDSSIVPEYNWKLYLNGLGPDFSSCRHEIYRFESPDIYTRNDHGDMLEVPPTVGYVQNFGKYVSAIRGKLQKKPWNSLHILGALDKLRILNYQWLSPELSNTADLIQVAKTMIAHGNTFLNVSLHSNSLIPGLNPFVRNEKDLLKLMSRIESLLLFARQNGMIFSTIGEMADRYPRT